MLLVGMVVLLISFLYPTETEHHQWTNLCRSFRNWGTAKRNQEEQLWGYLECAEGARLFHPASAKWAVSVVGGVTRAGLVNDIAKIFVRLSGDNLFIV